MAKKRSNELHADSDSVYVDFQKLEFYRTRIAGPSQKPLSQADLSLGLKGPKHRKTKNCSSIAPSEKELLQSAEVNESSLRRIRGQGKKIEFRTLRSIVKAISTMGGYVPSLKPADFVINDEDDFRELIRIHWQKENKKPPYPWETENIATQEPDIPTSPKHLASLPFRPNPFFSGREDLTLQLASTLTGQTSQIVAISGLGGVGKTQLALHVAYQIADSFSVIIWLQAGSSTEFQSAIIQWAKRLELRFDRDEREGANAEEALKYWLCSNSGWLLILDNADDIAVVQDFIPPVLLGQILITTRLRVLDRLGVIRLLSLSEFSENETEQFLRLRITNIEFDFGQRKWIKRLHDEMGGLPLAIEQAAAYIVELQLPSLTAYLDRFEEKRIALFNEVEPQVGNYSQTVATTWLVSFEAVKRCSKAAVELLRVTAFLRHSSPIPFTTIINAVDRLPQPLRSLISEASDKRIALAEAIAPLARFSLVKVEPQTETYWMHLLVQEVVRNLDEL